MRCTLALICICAVTAGAQSPPSFAGEWVRVDSAPARPTVAATGDAAFRTGDMGSGWGAPITIRQTHDSLVVEYVQFSTYDLQPRQRLAFALDGSETRNRVIVGHAESLQRARATWRGSELVITTLHPAPADVSSTPTQVQQVLSLDASGHLVVETTRPGFRGANVVRTSYARR
ncbi:MAG: hypothetical protein IT359_10160 [Gemmatimonadaceae bacterium]|nr:hypothetical protein [Gemmatimonadaceae bacterium]